MTGNAQRTAAQWALFCLLVLGVVGMHHVNVDADMPGGHTAVASANGEPSAPDEPAHDMLHMCLAILSVVASLALLGWLLVRLPRPSDSRATPAWPPAPARPPPICGRGLLNSLCVLRL